MIDFPEIKRLSHNEFSKFASLIYKESGIFLKDTKITLLSNRLRKRLKALNLESFSEYYDYIDALNDKSVLLWYGAQDLTLLASISAQYHHDFIVFSDLSHYKTSGAKETIFM